MMLKLLFALALGSASVAASGAEGTVTKRGWFVTSGGTEECGLSQTFEGPGETALNLVWEDGGAAGFVIDNRGWSSKAKERYDVMFELDTISYDGAAYGSIDTQSFRKGIAGTLPVEFFAHFAASDSLKLSLNGTLIDSLSLHGSAEAVEMLMKCVRERITVLKNQRRELERWSHIPKDPFAKATEAKSER